jgi:hypothetical protein
LSAGSGRRSAKDRNRLAETRGAGLGLPRWRELGPGPALGRTRQPGQEFGMFLVMNFIEMPAATVPRPQIFGHDDLLSA